MDLGRLVFMDIGSKRFRSALKELPNETIGMYFTLEKEFPEGEKPLCEVTFKLYYHQIEVYVNSNKIQGGINLNVSYIGRDFGKRIVFTPPDGAENVEGDKGILSFDYKGVHYLLTRFNNSSSD